MNIAITADLHWGSRHADGMAATHQLIADLQQDPPQMLILAGDLGAGDDFASCLQLFSDLRCRKALVPGNHDLWVRPDDARGNSLDVYHHVLPKIAAAYGFDYLDAAPVLLPEVGLGIVGSINWYDYSWGGSRVRELAPDWQHRLTTKRFSRGRHNDANFIRWPHDDASFTQACAAQLADHLRQATRLVDGVIVVTHHPSFRDLAYPKPEPMDLDAALWDSFSGNDTVERLLREYGPRIPFVFCGHTHYAREITVGPTRGYNIGGDYDFKRLIRLNWPAGTISAKVFG